MRSIGAQKAKWAFHHPPWIQLYTPANVLRTRGYALWCPLDLPQGPVIDNGVPFYPELLALSHYLLHARPFLPARLHECPFAMALSRELPQLYGTGFITETTLNVPIWADVEHTWTSILPSPVDGGGGRQKTAYRLFLTSPWCSAYKNGHVAVVLLYPSPLPRAVGLPAQLLHLLDKSLS